MREDLSDAYASADWAITQLKAFEKGLAAWLNSPPYSFIEDPQPQIGKKLIKLRIDKPLTGLFNAEVGSVINTIRTSLDLLASALAVRNGKAPSSDRHFPVYSSIMDFIDPLYVAKRKSAFVERDRLIIEGLKPYAGGNDRLFALHHFDVVRKHVRLIQVRPIPTAIVVHPYARTQGMDFPTMWPGFEDDAVIAWTDINATNSEFQMTVDVTFNEGDILANEPVGPALRDFWRMASMIIEMFE